MQFWRRQEIRNRLTSRDRLRVGQLLCRTPHPGSAKTRIRKLVALLTEWELPVNGASHLWTPGVLPANLSIHSRQAIWIVTHSGHRAHHAA